MAIRGVIWYIYEVFGLGNQPILDGVMYHKSISQI